MYVKKCITDIQQGLRRHPAGSQQSFPMTLTIGPPEVVTSFMERIADDVYHGKRDFLTYFVDAWEKFHTPKNFAMAVAGEAGELAAEFQWLTPTESERSALSPEQLDAVAMEIADVQIYLIRLADVLGIDIPDVVRKKIAISESRF